MRRLALALFLVLALVTQARAQTCTGLTGALSSMPLQTLTISTAAVALTVPPGASMAVVSVQNQPIRYRDDGTAPTSTVGVFLNGTATSPGTIAVCPRQLSLIQFIRDTAATGDATASVSYYTIGY